MQNTLAPKSRIKRASPGESEPHSKWTCFVCIKKCVSLLSFCTVIFLSLHCSHLQTQLLLRVCFGYYLLWKLSPRSFPQPPFLHPFYKYWLASVQCFMVTLQLCQFNSKINIKHTCQIIHILPHCYENWARQKILKYYIHVILKFSF